MKETAAMRRKYLLLSFAWLLGTLASLPLPAVEKPTGPTPDCLNEQCHATYRAKTYQHGPVALGDCRACHVLTEPKEHRFEITRQGPELCTYCHLEQKVDKVVHDPLAQGQCLSCHDPHGSNHRKFLRTDTIAELCQTCHENNWSESLSLHGPVASGECTICHDAHSAPQPKLLNETPPQLCYLCHETTQEELSELEHVHQPVKEGCATCHEVHAGPNRFMLKEAPPALCFECHDAIRQTAQNARFPHSVVTEPYGCTQCHTPHASSVRFNLKAYPLDLCLRCHDKPIPRKKGKPVASIKTEIEGKQFLHGPVQQKECSSCHIAHGSMNHDLLIKFYAPEFYAPFSQDNYALCFVCHVNDIVTSEKTDKLTNFRNGTENLHYLHVNRPERGRTCRACHATHASNLPKHIRESVPYGKWELPIQFEKTETGGKCKPGCHKPLAYDRNQPVDNNTGN